MSVGRFAHAHHEPSQHYIQELKKLEGQAWFKAGRAIKYTVDHSHPIYYLGGSSNKGDRIYVDKLLYPVIKKEKLLDGLIEHEVVEGILLRSKKYKYPEAHEIASAAEDLVYQKQGADAAKMQAKYPKLIKDAETDKFVNVPSDLRLDPYSPDLQKKMKEGMKKPIDSKTVSSMKRTLDPPEPEKFKRGD